MQHCFIVRYKVVPPVYRMLYRYFMKSVTILLRYTPDNGVVARRLVSVFGFFREQRQKKAFMKIGVKR